MGIYLTPAHMKPYSAVVNWLIQLAYEEETSQEYVYDGPESAPLLRGKTKYYTRYHRLTMSKDLTGNPERYKVFPDVRSGVLVPIENLIDTATGGLEYGRVSGEFDLYSRSGDKLVSEVYNMLNTDVRRVVSLPTQWLVWIPSRSMLTRLVFTSALKGEVIVRPFGSRGILLEVQDVTLDRVNEWDTISMKRACIEKTRFNDSWRSLVLSEGLKRVAGKFKAEAEEETSEEEPKPEGVGDIE